MNANSQLARRWMHEIWNDRCCDTITELMAPDAKGWMEGLTVNGPAEFEQAWRGLVESFPDMRITVESVISEGEETAIRWAVTGTHLGDSLGMKSTGRPVKFRGITWFVIRDGKIVEGWDSWNLGALLQALQAPAEA